MCSIGSEITSTKPFNTTRLIGGNLNGMYPFQPNSTSPTHHTTLDTYFTIYDKYATDIFCIQEHNCDMTQFNIREKFHSTIKQANKYHNLQIADSGIPFDSYYKPGGALIGTIGHTTGRISTSGTDQLGRWAWTSHQGSSRRITFISAYRPPASEPPGPQTAYQQQVAKLSQANRDVTPRQAFDHDLAKFIKTRQATGDEIVLQGDFNETINTGRSTLLTWICALNLTDAWSNVHPDLEDDFPTYFRGQTRIDYLFVSHNILPAIEKMAYIPKEIFSSDHLTLLVDFNTAMLYGNSTSTLKTAPTREWDTRNIDSTTAYLGHLQEIDSSKDISIRIKELLKLHTVSPAAIEQLDYEVGAAMESAASKLVRPRPAWFSRKSAKLQHKLSTLHQLLKFKHRQKDTSVIYQRAQLLEIEHELPLPTATIQDIRQAIDDTKQTLANIRKNSKDVRHEELRTEEQQAPDASAAKRLRALRHKETIIDKYHTFRKIKNRHSPRSAVDRIVIPNTWPRMEDNILDPAAYVDAKTFERNNHESDQHWRTVTNPQEIEFYLQVRNQKHFGQAAGSPFTVPPLSDKIPWNADSDIAQDIIRGRLEEYDRLNLPSNATRLFLEACSQSNTAIPGELTVEQFRSKMKVWRESTTTSPSGRHLAHYKSLAKRHPKLEDLRSTQETWESIHVGLINLCLKHRHVLNRWKDIINIMILKETNNYRIHRLRVIHIYEADYNLLLGVKYRQLQKLLLKKNLLNTNQNGGLPGHSATTLTFIEELINDISRSSRALLINVDQDAQACYDRIVVAVASIVALSYGQHASVVCINAENLYEARYRLKTALGVSARYYSHCQAIPLYGTGQGSANSPMLWCFISSRLFDIHHKHAHGASFSSPDKSVQINISIVGFVDDTTLRTTLDHPHERDISELLRRSQHDGQLWSDLLYATGGLLEIDKCSYHILSYTFNAEGFPRLTTQIVHPIQQLQHPETGQPTQQRYLPNTKSHKTLGHHKAPGDNGTAQVKAIIERMQPLTKDIAMAPIDSGTAFRFVQSIFNPTLGYTLPQSALSTAQLDKISQQVYPRVFAKCNYNRNTHRDILFGPTKWGGGGFIPPWVLQGEGQIQHFLKNWRSPTTQAGHIIRIGAAWAQMTAGLPISIFTDTTTQIPYLEAPWLSSLRRFMTIIQASFRLDREYTIPVQRVHDEHLMKIALDADIFSDHELRQINICRLYLEVTLVSDISNEAGTHILPNLWWGEKDDLPAAIDSYPYQTRPHAKCWVSWKMLLRLLTHSFQGPLLMELGPWTTSSFRRRWPTYSDLRHPNLLYHHSSNSTHFYQFEKVDSALFALGISRPEWTPDPTRHAPASITQLDPGQFRATYLPAPRAVNPPIHLAVTFHDHIRRLLPWQHLLLYDVHLDVDPYDLPVSFQQTTADDPIYIVTDGSQVANRISFGWTMKFPDGKPIAHGSGPGFATATSHRAEGHGPLAPLLFLQEIAKYTFQPLKGHVHILFDNSGLLTRVNERIEYGDILYPNETMRPDWDLVEEIYHLSQNSDCEFQFSHVDGHQDDDNEVDDLELTAQMNVDADYLAGEYMHSNYTPRTQAPLMTQTRCQLNIAERTITGHYVTAIREAATSRPFLQKLQTDQTWSDSTRNLISWEMYCKVIRQNDYRQPFMVKLVNNILPFKTVTVKYDKTSDDRCPHCMVASDTFDHMLRCPSACTQKWLQNWKKKNDKTRYGRTVRPSMLQFLREFAIAEWHDLPRPNIPPAYATAVQNQTKIGWTNLLRGFLAKDWTTLQLEYAKETETPPSRDPAIGLTQFLTSTIDAVYDRWIYHNDTIYGHDKSEKAVFLRQRLQKKIQALHDDRPNALRVDQDRLFQPDLPAFLVDSNTRTLQNWYNVFHKPINASVRQARKNLLRSLRPVSDFFRPIRRPPETTQLQPTIPLPRRNRHPPPARQAPYFRQTTMLPPVSSPRRQGSGRRPTVRLRAERTTSFPRYVIQSITNFFQAPARQPTPSTHPPS